MFVFVLILILALLALRILCLYKALDALDSNTKALAFIPSIGDVEFMSRAYLWSGGGGSCSNLRLGSLCSHRINWSM